MGRTAEYLVIIEFIKFFNHAGEDPKMTAKPVEDWIVLVVDDDKSNIGVAEAVLTHYGAQVLSASNGEEGLKLLDTINPTLILLDLSMPKLSGWEMLKRLRDTPKTASIPVIAVTAHAMRGDKQRVLDAGFNGYIPKPFAPANFIQDIQMWLDIIDPDDANSTAKKEP